MRWATESVPSLAYRPVAIVIFGTRLFTSARTGHAGWLLRFHGVEQMRAVAADALVMLAEHRRILVAQ